MGIEIEREHGDDMALAYTIAQSHLKSDPNYYSKLLAAGLVDEPSAHKIAQTDLAKSGQGGNVSIPLPATPNQIPYGKTLSKFPEPTISSPQGLVHKTTGARLPNSVPITKTKPIGGEAPNVVVVPAANTNSNPIERFLGAVRDDIECNDQLHEGGSTIKKK